jgi:serine/threonine-protein kinase HipA
MTLPDIKTLRVFLYDRPIGTLTHLAGDKNVFAFDEAYIEDSSRPILSLSFKNTSGKLITDANLTQTRLSPFFSNLLPEGPLLEYLALRANLNPKHEFFLLWALGKDLPGAITIQAVDEEGFSVPFIKENADSKKKRSIPLRFSLAGVQWKFSALEKTERCFLIPPQGVGGDWIIKLPHSNFRHIPENEYSMMELARRVGIDVPEIALYPLKDLQGLPKEMGHVGDKAFAIKRFDRTASGHRIHIEDFAQVFRVYPEKKYKSASYRNLAEVIWKEVGEAGIVEFIKRFVFNALIGNGDMHLKNWSLIYSEKTKPALAPAYDFVSTILYFPEDLLALNFVDSKTFESLSLEQFKRFALKAQLSEQLVLDTAKTTVQAFSEHWKQVKDLPLEEEVRKAIEKHLKKIPLWTQAF